MKSKEELITEAYIVVKKGFVKILALEEEEGGVDGNTDLFDKGGGQFICYCCCRICTYVSFLTLIPSPSHPIHNRFSASGAATRLYYDVK